MKRVLAISISALLLSGCAAHTASSAGGLEQWNANHPEAARDLCVWAHNHPDAARRFFTWDGDHPGRTLEFVNWTLANPGRGIDGFVSTHPTWAGFDFMSETHHPAANAFMGWVRQHPEAAQRLMMHPRGLEWASAHAAC